MSKSKEVAKMEPLQAKARSANGAGSHKLINEAREGVRTRRALMMKQFVPDPQWILQNVVGKPKGTHVIVGNVIGQCSSAKRTEHVDAKSGRTIPSIVLNGRFEGTSWVTGEVMGASQVYLPMAFAEAVATTFESDPSIHVIDVHVDVGLEATGKPTITYEWTVTSYIEPDEADALERLRDQRKRPKLAPKLLTEAKEKKAKALPSPAAD